MSSIFPIHAFTDNYIWAICDPAKQHVAIVDPGDSTPVLAIIKKLKLELSDIIITHHHADHTNGIKKLLKYKKVNVHGPNSENSHIPEVSNHLNSGDTIYLEKQDIKLNILEVPGHTLDHIAYYNDQLLFCGDTMFAGGCGRLFEGTPKQMLNSLNKFKQLPPTTYVYCAHEYTLQNLKFAKIVEPDNTELQTRIEQTEITRKNNQATVPSTIALELATNPFLRTNKTTIKQAVERHFNIGCKNEESVFANLRSWKDIF